MLHYSTTSWELQAVPLMGDDTPYLLSSRLHFRRRAPGYIGKSSGSTNSAATIQSRINGTPFLT